MMRKRNKMVNGKWLMANVFKHSMLCLFLVAFYMLPLKLSAQSFVPLVANAGANTGVCPNDSVRIGGSPSASGGTPPYNYSWQPTTGLDFPNVPNPNAFPSAPTNYTLTITDGAGNSASDVVNVTKYVPATVSAGPDQTILQGSSTQLTGTGAVNYYWTPFETLTNQNTASPTAEPATNTTYCMVGVDANGCSNFDCMQIFVTPSDTLLFYNAFTPNGDGINDVFYIGNIQQYPKNKLEVFNRNGKLVFLESPYGNDWDGKIDGLELPAATYYFVLTPGDGKAKVHGGVTITR